MTGQESQKTGVANLGFAELDLDRLERRGFPEAVFAEGKTDQQVAQIMRALVEKNGICLATRASDSQFAATLQLLPDARHDAVGRCIVVERSPMPRLPGKIAVVSAGTADQRVVEETRITLELFGSRTEIIQDVGVAGIHRVLAARERIEGCAVVVVVAGMEGALPTVVAGLVSKPVIAVPTSIGYGANFGGISALLGMLTSCASGVTVVNIDNGFGAAYAASLINRLAIRD